MNTRTVKRHESTHGEYNDLRRIYNLCPPPIACLLLRLRSADSAFSAPPGFMYAPRAMLHEIRCSVAAYKKGCYSSGSTSMVSPLSHHSSIFKSLWSWLVQNQKHEIAVGGQSISIAWPKFALTVSCSVGQTMYPLTHVLPRQTQRRTVPPPSRKV